MNSERAKTRKERQADTNTRRPPEAFPHHFPSLFRLMADDTTAMVHGHNAMPPKFI